MFILPYYKTLVNSFLPIKIFLASIILENIYKHINNYAQRLNNTILFVLFHLWIIDPTVFKYKKK